MLMMMNMATDADIQQGARTLLGLRPPAGLADGNQPVRVAASSAVATPVAAVNTPDRPSYPVVSSGWDSEDEESRGKTSDLMTAVRALVVLSLFIVAISLLIR